MPWSPGSHQRWPCRAKRPSPSLPSSSSCRVVQVLPLFLLLLLLPTHAFQRKGPSTPSSSSSSSSAPLPFSSRLVESGSSVNTPLSSPWSSSFSSSPWEGPAASLPTPLAQDAGGPFRLTFDEASDCFVFQTATVELQQPNNPGTRVRLVGSVHIADPAYFKTLEQACTDCDVVLYEMITSEGNVLRDETDARWPHKEQLGVELAATTELRRLALAHGLEPQLDNMHFFGKKNWYLSDITREKLCTLQRARGERALDDTTKSQFAHLQEMAQIFWNGFTSRGKVLPKFLFVKGENLNALPFRLLRLCMWLTPAPELQLLLLDWARQYPPAGGLSKILRSMVGALVHGDLLTVRRLAFSQMLTSSQTSPPPEVLVLERNSKVVLDVEQALASGAQEIGVLYGGLHMKDMEAKLRRHLNFTRVDTGAGAGEDGNGVQWHTAWTMPAYTTQRQALVATLCVALPLLHLGVGGLDWSATFGGLAKDVSQSLVDGAAAVEPAVGWQEVFLYLLRHMYIYYGLSRWVVEWEKKLFELR